MLIAHLSDLHLRDEDDVVQFRRQLDRIVAHDVDHLVLTGDLLDRWNPTLLTRALDALQERGLLNAERATILHGNHDLASSGGHPRRPADLRRLVLRFWDPPPLIRWRRRRFYATIERRSQGVAQPAPFLKNMPSRLRLAVLDTVPISWHAVSFSTRRITIHNGSGCVRQAQARWLAGLRGAPRAVVLIHHYPLAIPPIQWDVPYLRRGVAGALRMPTHVAVPMEIVEPDRRTFWNAAQQAGAQLVLCGHVHRTRLEHHEGIAVGLNGQSGAAWAGRTIAYYRIEDDRVTIVLENDKTQSD